MRKRWNVYDGRRVLHAHTSHLVVRCSYFAHVEIQRASYLPRALGILCPDDALAYANEVELSFTWAVARPPVRETLFGNTYRIL